MKKMLFFVSIFSIITHYSMSFAQENETFGLIPVKAIHTFSTNEASQLRSSLPQSYDLRDYYSFLPTRSQGKANTCWAIATCSAIETAWTKDGKENVNYLSPKHLVLNHNCRLNGSYTTSQGGNTKMSAAYLSSGEGPVLETQCPYILEDSDFATGNVIIENKEKADLVKEILKFSDSENADITTIKNALYNYGPVVIGMDETLLSNSSFYDNSNHSCYSTTNSGKTHADHAGIIVGWDDTFDKFDNLATKPSNPGAWIVQNTWGEDKNDNGFYYMSYECKTFTTTDATVFKGNIARKDVDYIYQYDKSTGGAFNIIPSGMQNFYIKSSFETTEKETITHVGLYILDANTTVSIEIKSNGTSLAYKTKTYTVPGFYFESINANLSQNTPFDIILHYHHETGARIATGETISTQNTKQQYSGNGTKWYSMSEDNKVFFCTKVLTKKTPNSSNKQIENDDVKIVATTNGLTIQTQKTEPIFIYSATGHLLFHDFSPKKEIHIPASSNQLYIIRVGEKVYKFIK